MANKHFWPGILALATAMAVIGCDNGTTSGGGGDPTPVTADFTGSAADFAAWLADQPANTAAAAYTAALNVDDIAELRTTLNNNPDKYVYLDLSGSAITTIPDNAFFDDTQGRCVTLTGITIPGSVTGIGVVAFAYCRSLTGVTISDGVKSIESYAFSNCTSLAGVTIPDSVTTIGYGAFKLCTSLTEISVAAGNSAYASEGGVLYNKNKTALIQYPAGKTGASFTIPTGVTSIGQSAFSGCTGLASVTIPDSVTGIGDVAFRDCDSLSASLVIYKKYGSF